MNQAAIPTPLEDRHSDDRWLCIHKLFLSEAKEKEPDIVFLGDFTMAFLAQTEVWEQVFAPLHCLNFGIVEDQTQHVLWRIENGEIDAINPKVIVLSVGANNHDHSAEEITEGIITCAKAASAKQPNATVVVLKLLPCGHHPNVVREKYERVNELLVLKTKELPHVETVSVDPGFVAADGTISHHDFYDYLHLTRRGYRRAFEQLADLLHQLLLETSGDLSPSFE